MERGLGFKEVIPAYLGWQVGKYLAYSPIPLAIPVGNLQYSVDLTLLQLAQKNGTKEIHKCI